MQSTLNDTRQVNSRGAVESKASIGSKRHLRVVHIVSSLKVGGMEQVVLSLGEAQQSDGHDVIILALHGGPLEETARQRNLRTIILRGRNRFSRIRCATQIFARLQPDIIHAHNPTSLHYAVIGKFVGRTRVLMTDHAQTRGVVRVPSILERHLIDEVVAVSQDTANKANTRGPNNRITVIHNGVSLAPSACSKAFLRAQLGLGEEPVGIMVAGFDKVKGHAVLLEAIARISATKHFLMLIVGGGTERENIEQQAKELKLGPERIKFLGIRSDVSELLAASDFFVLPSLMEGLPLAVLEAMTARLPVIATSVGGVPELVENGVNGILIPPNDAHALGRAMLSLVCSVELRAELGSAGSQRVNSEFTFRQMTSKYEDLYYRLYPAKEFAIL